MAVQDETLTNIAGRQIVSLRVINAHRSLVFEAWENPKHLAEWWGPNGFANDFEEFDFNAGGTWKFIMHGPTGVNYPNKSIFVEIVKPKLIVLDHVSKPQFRLIIKFEETGTKTKLIFTMLFRTVEECNKIKPVSVNANEEMLDRLEAELAKMQ